MNTGNYDVMYTLPYEYEEGMLRDLKDARGVEAMALKLFGYGKSYDR